MRYIGYKVDGANFNYTDDTLKTSTIPLRIDGRINKTAIKIVDSIRNEIFLNNFKELIKEDISKLYYNLNNNIKNDETSYFLAKLIVSALRDKEVINLSSLIDNNEKFKEVEYLMEEIDTFNIMKNKKGIADNIEKIKQYEDIKYYIEEYYLPLIEMKKRAF